MSVPSNRHGAAVRCWRSSRRPIQSASRLMWNGSWNGRLSNPSSAVASRAMSRAIYAAKGSGAAGRTSCKRQVSGSNPLTGSQVEHFSFR